MNGSAVQNVLKEVDMQIVYRRMEARKRNITGSGQMSKQQLATAYRGYHGLESQYHALQHMSNDAMMYVKRKNDKIQTRHVDGMKTLIDQERLTKQHTNKELQNMRDDFTAQLAYQYVYNKHSFKRFYNAEKPKKPRPASDKPELYELERLKSLRSAAPRPLGSLRQESAYKDELNARFPPIQDAESNDRMSPRVNMMGGKTYQAMQDDSLYQHQQEDRVITSFPNIEGALGVEIKYKNKTREDDKMSLVSAPPAGLEAESPTPQNMTLDMGQNLLLMKRKQQENYEMQRRRLLPSVPKEGPKSAGKRREGWKRMLPEPPSRPSTVFPGTARTPMGMKKMVDREATEVLEHWAASSRRNQIVEKVKERNKAEMLECPIPVVDGHRPTSAILRDYQEYKKKQEERERQANEQEVIIAKRISPQERPESPVAQQRKLYNAKLSPIKNKRNRSKSPKPKAGKLHRTESEQSTIPSVSRTASYKNIPEDELAALQEKAQMTAAERIAFELGKLESDDQDKQTDDNKSKENANDTAASEEKHKVRQLPLTPKRATKRSKETKMPQPRKPGTPIPQLHGDIDHIDKVKLANLIHKEPTFGAEQVPQNNEHDSYMPIIKQRGNSATGKVAYTQENVARMKIVSALYDQEHWQKLSKRMHFNYENFTRAPPDKRKQLEIRAKNRRKIHMRNAQLEDERRTQLSHEKSGKLGDTDRPSTRVSFNENVIVFQTI